MVFTEGSFSFTTGVISMKQHILQQQYLIINKNDMYFITQIIC